MATQIYTIAIDDTWTEVAGDGDFLIENRSFSPCRITMSDTPPAEDTKAYHLLQGKNAFVRIGSGNCYVKSDGRVNTTLIVTT